MPLAFYIIKGYSDAHKMPITRNNKTDRKINCFNNNTGFLNYYLEVLRKHSAAAMITDLTDGKRSCGCWAVPLRQIKPPSMWSRRARARHKPVPAQISPNIYTQARCSPCVLTEPSGREHGGPFRLNDGGGSTKWWTCSFYWASEWWVRIDWI